MLLDWIGLNCFAIVTIGLNERFLRMVYCSETHIRWRGVTYDSMDRSTLAFCLLSWGENGWNASEILSGHFASGLVIELFGLISMNCNCLINLRDYLSIDPVHTHPMPTYNQSVKLFWKFCWTREFRICGWIIRITTSATPAIVGIELAYISPYILLFTASQHFLINLALVAFQSLSSNSLQFIPFISLTESNHSPFYSFQSNHLIRLSKFRSSEID